MILSFSLWVVSIHKRVNTRYAKLGRKFGDLAIGHSSQFDGGGGGCRTCHRENTHQHLLRVCFLCVRLLVNEASDSKVRVQSLCRSPSHHAIQVDLYNTASRWFSSVAHPPPLLHPSSTAIRPSPKSYAQLYYGRSTSIPRSIESSANTTNRPNYCTPQVSVSFSLQLFFKTFGYLCTILCAANACHPRAGYLSSSALPGMCVTGSSDRAGRRRRSSCRFRNGQKRGEGGEKR